MSPVRSQSPNITFSVLVRPIPIAAHDLEFRTRRFPDAVHGQFLAGVCRGSKCRFEGMGRPMDPLKSKPVGLAVATGEVSVNPQPWVTMQPVNLFPTSGHHCLQGHAAGEGDAQRLEVHGLEARRVQQRVEERVDAADEIELVFSQFGHERLEVARIRDQHVCGRPRGEGQAIGREREDCGTAAARWTMTRASLAFSEGVIQAADCSTFATMLRLGEKPRPWRRR